MAVFFMVVMVVLTLLGSLAGFRLWLPLKLGLWPTAALWAAVQALAFAPLCLLFAKRQWSLPRGTDLLSEAGWLVVGWLSLAFFLILGRDLLAGLLRLGPPALDGLRAALAGRPGALAVVVLTSLLVLVGMVNAYRMDRVVRVEVPLAGLHPDLAGLRIAQISDLHVGPGIRRAQVERVVAAVNALQPDLVVFTGDLADGLPGELAPEAAPLARLRAPLGRWFITGNHEYYSGVEGWLRVAEGLGLQPLLNEHVLLKAGSATLQLAGVPDVSGGHFLRAHQSSPQAAMLTPLGSQPLTAPPAADVRILLAHQPASVFEAQAAGFELMLSGHTHGGQYAPFTWMAGRFNPYLKGLNRHSERLQVYVNTGTGFWGPPIRLGTAPEITLLTLRKV